jgi:hypothetical protein
LHNHDYDVRNQVELTNKHSFLKSQLGFCQIGQI